MHHTLRYGKHKLFKVISYGDITETEKETMRLMAQRNAINDGYTDSEVYFIEKLSELGDADAVVFCRPLYVDGVPSHVLPFLKEMEDFCKENELHLKVYVISNNGFIEGNQSRVIMQIMENFCARSNMDFGGGIGIGGGVMLNVMRIVLMVQVGVFLFNIVLCGIQSGVWLPWGMIVDFLKSIAIVVFFQLGVFWYMLRMGIAINRKAIFGKKYTRILVPSFLFILFADIFFVIISIAIAVKIQNC